MKIKLQNHILVKIFGKHIDGKVYFVSPHLDDAIFSGAELISKLRLEGVEIEVINIFTSCGRGRNTLSALKFIFDCGYRSPHKLLKDRILEDQKIWKSLGIKSHYLGETDALWRTNGNKEGLIAEMDHVYPTHRLHVSKGKVSYLDSQLISTIATKILHISGGGGTLVCPIAGEIHVDHMVARLSCELVSNRVIYWEDYPYKPKVVLSNKHKRYVLKVNKNEKLRMISEYKTQLKAIFKSKIKIGDEVYYRLDTETNPSVEIGIPALNEEAHIGRLLRALTMQHLPYRSEIRINVLSDGSVDRTNEIVLDFSKKHKWIKLYPLIERKGLSNAQNTLNRISRSDINIILNADVTINDRWFIRKLINPIIREDVDLVSSAIRAKEGRTKISKILKTVSDLKEDLYGQINDGDNIYACHGPARALSKPLYKHIRFIEDSGEDGYSYVFAKVNGYKFKYQTISQLYYTNPQNLGDYLNQSIRFQGLNNVLSDYFEKDIVDHYIKIPLKDLISVLIRIVISPRKMYLIFGYFFLFIYSRYCYLFTKRQYRGQWLEVRSSKI